MMGMDSAQYHRFRQDNMNVRVQIAVMYGLANDHFQYLFCHCLLSKRAKTSYLNQKYDEKVEVGHSPELLKHVLGDKVPKCVLENMNTSGLVKKEQKKPENIFHQ